MRSNWVFHSTLLLIGFFLLVIYNYLLAQKSLQDTGTSMRSIDISTSPESLPVGSLAPFVWRVSASPDLTSSSTSIYWGYQSTPSALTTFDSPQAVGYEHFQKDYFLGTFPLPSDFSASIRVDRPGTVYFRAYAKVGEDHLWTPEMSFEVFK